MDFSPPKKVRQISPHTDRETAEDLAYLVHLALAEGAFHAEVVRAADICWDRDVRYAKPEEPDWVSSHWPLDFPLDNVREACGLYENAVLFTVSAPSDIPDYGPGKIMDNDHRLLYQKVYEISALLESAAFYLGYHLSMGFAAGNCRSVFCFDRKNCRALLHGRACRHPYKSRPSMRAAGIHPEKTRQRCGFLYEEGKTFITGIVFVG